MVKEAAKQALMYVISVMGKLVSHIHKRFKQTREKGVGGLEASFLKNKPIQM